MKKNRKDKNAPPPGLPPETDQIVEEQPKKQPFLKRLLFGEETPIVSTRQPDQILQYAPLIHIADDAAGFAAACEAALCDTQPERTALRIEEGRKSSWDARVAQMCDVLAEQGIF